MAHGHPTFGPALCRIHLLIAKLPRIQFAAHNWCPPKVLRALFALCTHKCLICTSSKNWNSGIVWLITALIELPPHAHPVSKIEIVYSTDASASLDQKETDDAGMIQLSQVPLEHTTRPSQLRTSSPPPACICFTS